MSGWSGLLVALVALAAGDPAPPALDVVTLEGKREAIDLPGQVTIVDFFATWCPHCREAVADYDALLAKYRGRARMIVVDVEEPAEVVTAFFARHALPEGATLVLDPRGTVVRSFGPKAFPSVYVLDGSGVVRHVQRGWGEGSADRLGRSIGRLVADPEAGPAGAVAVRPRRAQRRGRPSPAEEAAPGTSADERARRMGVEILH